MGPVRLNWYRERGLTEIIDSFETITEMWFGGRIDIYGVEDDVISEYGVPTMDGPSWRSFSEWLYDVESESLLSFDELIEKYTEQTGKTIRWANDVWKENDTLKS